MFQRQILRSLESWSFRVWKNSMGFGVCVGDHHFCSCDRRSALRAHLAWLLPTPPQSPESGSHAFTLSPAGPPHTLGCACLSFAGECPQRSVSFAITDASYGILTTDRNFVATCALMRRMFTVTTPNCIICLP